MLLMLEIILTVTAWKRGWKALALLPLGIVIAIGLLFGIAAGASGGSVDSMKGMLLLLDLSATVALVIMCVKKKANILLPEEKPSGSAEQVR